MVIGALVVISHDRHFLNSVCTHIADIDYQTIIQYTGNYDDMVRQKALVRSQVEQGNQKKMDKIKQLQDFVSKFGAGTRSTQAASRKKEIERLRPDEIKRSNIARPYIRFEFERQSGREVLTTHITVLRIYEQSSEPRVDLDCTVTNQAGESKLAGVAVASLPVRG